MATANREVILYKWSRDLKTREGAGEGIFLGWGINFEECTNGVGSYSTAIVELPDGNVVNQPVELIQFRK